MISPHGHYPCCRWREHPLYHHTGENLQVPGRVGAAGYFLLELAAGEDLRFGNTCFFPVFLSLNLVYDIEYQVSKRREEMGF